MSQQSGVFDVPRSLFCRRRRLFLFLIATRQVSRVDARSENYEMDLTLDVHSDLFPLDFGDKFTFALASTLDLSGAPDSGEYNQVFVAVARARVCVGVCC